MSYVSREIHWRQCYCLPKHHQPLSAPGGFREQHRPYGTLCPSQFVPMTVWPASDPDKKINCLAAVFNWYILSAPLTAYLLAYNYTARCKYFLQITDYPATTFRCHCHSSVGRGIRPWGSWSWRNGRVVIEVEQWPDWRRQSGGTAADVCRPSISACWLPRALVANANCDKLLTSPRTTRVRAF